ncbi:MAG: hypothetical protein J7K87_03765 [Candidatus Aenigmarchaeota archaeon]|nr:hypothetical protein [Candidatus Aenigmarchaeota archaeon]
MRERTIKCHPIIYPIKNEGGRGTGQRIGGEEVDVKLFYDDNGNIVGVNCPYKSKSICNVPEEIIKEHVKNPEEYTRGHCLPQIKL